MLESIVVAGDRTVLRAAPTELDDSVARLSALLTGAEGNPDPNGGE